MDCNLNTLVCLPPYIRMQGRAANTKRSRGDLLRAARLDRIRAHIDTHLADPELSAHAAARALGMSVRSLHLALAQTGKSFGALVQGRRLAACHAKLRRPDHGATIADIAFECGFNSLSSFYRAFRRAYGTSPTEATESPLNLAA